MTYEFCFRKELCEVAESGRNTAEIKHSRQSLENLECFCAVFVDYLSAAAGR